MASSLDLGGHGCPLRRGAGIAYSAFDRGRRSFSAWSFFRAPTRTLCLSFGEQVYFVELWLDCFASHVSSSRR